jgi:hypothetical protein
MMKNMEKGSIPEEELKAAALLVGSLFHIPLTDEEIEDFANDEIGLTKEELKSLSSVEDLQKRILEGKR